jgi:hypothetical protein
MQLQQNDDPIFADIDLYRSAKSKWQAMSDDVSGKVIDWNAGKVIDCACDVTPTTAAGFVAKLRVLAAEDIIDQEEGDAEERMIFADFAALDAA